jgi:hypothetical protein
MRKSALDPHDDGLGHLAGENLADALFAVATDGLMEVRHR